MTWNTVTKRIVVVSSLLLPLGGCSKDESETPLSRAQNAQEAAKESTEAFRESVNTLGDSLENIEDQINDLKTERDDLQGEIAQLKDQLEEKELALTEERAAKQKAEQELSNMKKALAQAAETGTPPESQNKLPTTEEKSKADAPIENEE